MKAPGSRRIIVLDSSILMLFALEVGVTIFLPAQLIVIPNDVRR